MKAVVHQSHTGTQQWQSFELRMRQRRVQRCILRASEALEAHRLVEARASLEEAQQLDPDSLDVSELAARVASAEAAPAPVTQSGRRYMGAAAALLVLAAGAGWLWIGSTSTTTLVPEATIVGSSLAPLDPGSLPLAHLPQIVVSAPAEPVLEQTGPAAESAVTAVGSAPPPREAPARDAPAREVTAGTAGERPAVSTEAASSISAVSSPAVPAAPPRRDPPAPPAASVQSAAATTAPTATRPASPEPPPSPAPLLAETPAPTLDLSTTPGPPPEPVPAPVAATEAPAPVAATEAPAAGAATEAPAAAPVVAPEREVRAALNRYQSAYSALDAAAAGAIWPSVDRQALARAFDGLASQSVTLGRCDVHVNGQAATAECTGQARWTPKVGGGTQSAARQWRFELTHAGDAWIITQATVR